MEIREMLISLGKADGISGFEENIKEKVKEMLLPFCEEVKLSRGGSVIGIRRCGRENAPKLMLEAHLDQIGLMVTGIDDNGFVKFTNIGGVDSRILPSSEVYVLGNQKVYGVVGAKPPHLKGKEDKDKLPEIGDLLIDTGMDKEALQKQISVGDAIIMKNEFTPLLNNECFAPAMDNRAGMTAVLSAIEGIENSSYDIYIAFSTEEELGLHGAYSVAREIQPDLAVVVDVTHGMTPDTKDEIGVFNTGSGTIICRGPNFDNSLTRALVECAKKNGVKYDIEVAAGNSGTNAWAIQTAMSGIKTLLLSIPLKYMHTSVETLDLSDIEETARLIKIICEGGLLNA